MFDIGRICMKIAGRDAGKYCVIVEVLDSNMVLIDGQTRRRKCNIKHLEPLDKSVKISKAASHSQAVKALTDAGFESKEKTSKRKEKTERKKKQKKVKASEKTEESAEKEKKKVKKETKKEEKKTSI